MLLALSLLVLSADPLVADGCARWKGRMWGNDHSVRTSLWLCRRGEALCGTLRWSGVSGENLRALKGAVREGVVTLRDEKFLENKPKLGWRFCFIDSYRLERDGKTGDLSGSYYSSACRDEAGISLEVEQGASERLSCFEAPPNRM